MMLLNFFSFSLIFFKPLPRKRFFPSWIYELALIGVLLWKEALIHSFEWAKDWNVSRTLGLESLALGMCCRNRCLEMARVVYTAVKVTSAKIMLLDLPGLTIDCILMELSATELVKMAGVCSNLREICGSDYLWKRHMKEKWGRILGEAAFRKWEMQIASKKEFDLCCAAKGVESNWRVACIWPFLGFQNKEEVARKLRIILPVDSLMSFYRALESGVFSFTAQVYNRENGNEGFLMSCYDAEICYNYRANKFYARYPPHGKKVPAIEEVQWERIRAPPVTNSAHDLHISECLPELKPGDHIEIQWRNNKDLPYGWWYAVVGHLEVCHGNAHLCYCQSSDIIAVEFNHHAPGSKWRRKMINRNEHLEDWNEIDGFYGGIRKIQTKEEISTWLQFWPAKLQS